MVKKKRARLSGALLPLKRGTSFSPQTALSPDEMENPIPIDITPNPPLKLPARSYFKASRNRKKASAPALNFSHAVLENESPTSTNLGDLVVSPSSK
jgi:hypothetical protein